MPGTPRKARRFGGDAAHQKAIMGNLLVGLVAAYPKPIETTEAKAKALRPIAEKMITKALKGGVHNQRQVVAFMGANEDALTFAHKLFTEIAPACSARPGGYLRILKLGPRHGDAAPMAKIEFVDV